MKENDWVHVFFAFENRIEEWQCLYRDGNTVEPYVRVGIEINNATKETT
jgi:hypothetical protein